MTPILTTLHRMRFAHHARRWSGLLAAAAVLGNSTPVLAIDAAAAEMLARQNGCFKCHSIEKKKDGPPYREVAAKYKGKAGAEAKLYHHVTSGEKAKFPDGHEEDHKIIKTTDAAEIKNLIGWILSL
jgi:cytochrome c